MKCNKCNVNVESKTNICPLCKNELKKEGNEENVFPVIPTIHKGHGIFLKILLLIFLASSIICFAVDTIINKTVSWSLIVLAANMCVALTIALAIKRRHNFAKLTFSEYLVIIIGSILWDYFTGWNKWSLNYVLPLVTSIYIYITFILRLFFPYQLKNYFLNILFACLLGIVPGILLLCNITNISWPTYVSTISSIVMFSSLIVFDYKKIKKEFESRFHV